MNKRVKKHEEMLKLEELKQKQEERIEKYQELLKDRKAEK